MLSRFYLYSSFVHVNEVAPLHLKFVNSTCSIQNPLTSEEAVPSNLENTMASTKHDNTSLQEKN